MKPYKKIFVFGNSLIEADSLPLLILPELEKKFPWLDFIIADPVEMLPFSGGRILVLDTIKGLEDVRFIENLDLLAGHKAVSVHDYDLYFDLKLWQKLKKFESVGIIGVPMDFTVSQALAGVTKVFKAIGL